MRQFLAKTGAAKLLAYRVKGRIQGVRLLGGCACHRLKQPVSTQLWRIGEPVLTCETVPRILEPATVRSKSRPPNLLLTMNLRSQVSTAAFEWIDPNPDSQLNATWRSGVLRIGIC